MSHARHRTATTVASLVLALAVLVAGCSDDDNSAGGPTTTAAPTSTSTAATTPTTTAAPSTTTAAPTNGCPAGGPAIPAGSRTGSIPDVDGDGRPDTAYLTPGGGPDLQFGIATASGGGATFPFNSASPVRRRALVVNADERGPLEIFLDDGRSVGLLVFQDCRLVAVKNPQGAPYTFSLGFTGAGTGVGCVDVDGDGKRDLVGLNVTKDDGGPGTVEWTRTTVELDGASAENGPTDTGIFTRPQDDAAIQLLHEVTCGDLGPDAGLVQ